MLTCKQASFLASKKLDKKLTMRERFDFSLHTAMCGLCRRYAKEIEALHQLMQKVAKTNSIMVSKNENLSEQSRERIKQEINKELHSTQ